MTKTTIGLLSKLMRMTPEAIRFYEKKHIISPKRRIDSQYREYSLADIKKLYDCKNLRNLHFTLKEVDYLMTEASLDENSQALQNKKLEIEKNIQTELMVLNKIDRALAASQLYQQAKHQYTIKTNIDYAFYTYAKNDILNLPLVTSPIYQQVMDLPNLFSCSVLFDGTIADHTIEFGFSIETTLAHEYNISMLSPVKLVQFSMALHTVIKTDAIIQPNDLQPILDWAVKNNYIRHPHCIFARLISSFYHLGNEQRYYEIYLPILNE